MPVLSQIKEFIKKLQNLPLWQRKAILWTVVAILAVIFLLFWWSITQKGLKKINPGDAIKPFIPAIGEDSLDQENTLQMPEFKEQKEEIE